MELLSDQSALIKTLIGVQSVSKLTAANRVNRARKARSPISNMDKRNESYVMHEHSMCWNYALMMITYDGLKHVGSSSVSSSSS